MHSNNRSQVYVRTSSIFQSINNRHNKCIWLPKLYSSKGGVLEIKITHVCYNNSLIDLVMRKLLFFFCICKTKTQISWAVTAQLISAVTTQLISAVTAQLISAFVFAIPIVQSIFYVHTKFCVGPRRNPDRFSNNKDQLATTFVLIKNPENPRNITVVVINKDT